MRRKIYLSVLFTAGVMLAIAQSPGGYNTGLKLWIKSDAAATIDSTGGGINSWMYANDNTKVFTATGSTRPVLTVNNLNFLPTATFAGSQLMIGPDHANAPLAAGNPDYCLFAVWRSTTTGAFQRVWSQRHLGAADDATGFALATWNDGRYGDQMEKYVYDQAMLLNQTANQWNISHLNLLDQSVFTSNDVEERDQNSVTGAAFTATSSFPRHLVDSTNHLGARDSSIDEPLMGDIAEVIVYDDPITSATVRSQIFSYLALKWGINKPGDYLASDGTTTYWSATTNAGYTNSVFGIGMDNNSGLLVSHSNSAATGSGNGAGQSGQANMVLSGASSLSTNLNFLMIGNDNGALTEISTNLPTYAAGSQRLTRQWKAQHTGNVGTVNLDIDLTGVSTSGAIGTPADFSLMIDPDGDGDFTDNLPTDSVYYARPVGFTGNVAHFAGITLPNGAVFTLITQTNAALPVTWQSFTAKAVDNDVLLQWKVLNNEQASHYDIQHSVNGLDYITIGTVTNSATVQTYNFTHTNVAAGKHFYRILQTDFDGKSIYSPVDNVSIKGVPFNIRLLNNPVNTGFAQLEINAVTAANAGIGLYTLSGQHISEQQQGVSAGSNVLQVPMSKLASGNYLLKVNVNGTVQTMQVSKL